MKKDSEEDLTMKSEECYSINKIAYNLNNIT